MQLLPSFRRGREVFRYFVGLVSALLESLRHTVFALTLDAEVHVLPRSNQR